MKKRRKINIEKMFCFISFMFLLTCVFWYGGRIIYFYLDNKKIEENNDSTNYLAEIIIDENKDSNNFKSINDEYYFYKDAQNNYLTYSNILWRIIKITENNEIVLIAEDKITALAYGEDMEYNESYINMWLNKTDKNNTGILEQNLNNVDKYLTKTKVCIDKIETSEDVSCKDTEKNYYIGLLSLTDYINTGATESFINNGTYTYLSNKDKDNNIWYLTKDGKINTSTGSDIYGIKPVITLTQNIETLSGNGNIDNPYIIEEETTIFGAYVKLDTDLWRIYEVNDTEVKLVLNDYLTINDEKITHKYSSNNYYHNDTKTGSLAYYLNHDYLNTLSYKDIINNTNTWPNYYYNNNTNYNYQTILDNEIDTKVSIISLGNIILNNTLEYTTNTGTGKNEDKIYIIKEDGTTSERKVSQKSSIVPCISINKDLLTKGTGSKEEPYETE